METSSKHLSVRSLVRGAEARTVVPERFHYIDVSAVSSESLEIRQTTSHERSTAPSRAQKPVRSGDTIFATVRPGLKRVAMVPPSLDGAVASTAFAVLRPEPTVIDPCFLFFSVSADAFVSAVSALQTGASYPAVRDRDVLDQTIWVPSLNVQRDIAAVLELVRTAVRSASSAAETAARLKVATMQELFTRGLQGEAQKELLFGLVPGSWEEKPLSSVAEVQTGAAKGRKFQDAEIAEVPYLRVANVQDGHLDLTEMKSLRIRTSEIERYRLRRNDVVLTEGGDFDKLGRGFIWRDELPLCIHQNHVFAVRTNTDVLLPEFFAYLAQSAYGKAYFLQVAHKTTNLACINSTKLKAFPVVLPSTAEQRDIAQILGAIDQKIRIHKKKRATLNALFESLLHKLMSGEVRVDQLDLSALPIVGKN